MAPSQNSTAKSHGSTSTPRSPGCSTVLPGWRQLRATQWDLSPIRQRSAVSVSRTSAPRPPTEPLVPLTATCRISRVAGAFLLLVLLTSPRESASDPGAAPDDRGPAPAVLAASVSEMPDAVRLRIQASGDVEL